MTSLATRAETKRFSIVGMIFVCIPCAYKWLASKCSAPSSVISLNKLLYLKPKDFICFHRLLYIAIAVVEPKAN